MHTDEREGSTMAARPDRLDSKALATHCTTCGAWPATIRPAHGVAYCEGCGQPKVKLPAKKKS